MKSDFVLLCMFVVIGVLLAFLFWFLCFNVDFMGESKNSFQSC